MKSLACPALELTAERFGAGVPHCACGRNARKAVVAAGHADPGVPGGPTGRVRLRPAALGHQLRCSAVVRSSSVSHTSKSLSCEPMQQALGASNTDNKLVFQLSARALRAGPSRCALSTACLAGCETRSFTPTLVRRCSLTQRAGDCGRYVHSELIHSRFAMAGVAGILIPDILTHVGLLNVPVWYQQGLEAQKGSFAPFSAFPT